MILGTNILLMLAAAMTRAYGKWREYYGTIVFVSLCNLLYNFFCDRYLLWALNPEILLNHKTADLLNTVVFLPATVLLYLKYFPGQSRWKYLYYVLWVLGYSALEFTWYAFGRITYHHGWNFFWSMGFYLLMFMTIRLHETRRAAALWILVLTTAILLVYFKVPFFKEG